MAPIADFLAGAIPWSLQPHLQGYVIGKTPLSTPKQVFPTLAGYLAVVFGLRKYMKNRSPLKLQGLFQLHNIFLSAGSLLLLSCMAEEIAPLYWKHGLFWVMCDEGMWNKVNLSHSTRRIRVLNVFPCSEAGALLPYQLLLQVPRAHRHCLFGAEEEASGCVFAREWTRPSSSNGALKRSCMCSTTPLRPCYVTPSLTGRRVWYVAPHDPFIITPRPHVILHSNGSLSRLICLSTS